MERIRTMFWIKKLLAALNQTRHGNLIKISDKFYLIFEWEIQIWPKVLVKKVTMQCTKVKTHTDACNPCKINKTDNFSPILVTSMHKTDFFLITEIYMGFPYILEAVFRFLPKC